MNSKTVLTLWMLRLWKLIGTKTQGEDMLNDGGRKKSQAELGASYSLLTRGQAAELVSELLDKQTYSKRPSPGAWREAAKLQSLPLTSIKSNPIQPPGRTTGRDMIELTNNIDVRGVINPPYVGRLNGELYFIDGHRRGEACRLLGHVLLQSKVVDVSSLSELAIKFAELNVTVKRLTGANWFYSWSRAENRDGFLHSLKKVQARRIREFVRVFGERESVALAELGTDPSILHYGRTAHGFLCRWLDSAPSIKRVTRWVVAHKAVALVRDLNNNGSTSKAKKLLGCIQSSEPYVVRKKTDA